MAAATPAGLRRRRAAAARLPRLASGKRDPIAPVRTLLDVRLGRFTAWYFGLDRRQFVVLCRRAEVDRWMLDAHTFDTPVFCTPRAAHERMLAVADHTLGFRTSVRDVAL